MSDPCSEGGVSRRQFLKASGATSAVLGGAGVGLFGYAAGTDPNSYLGWQTHEGVNQYFDRRQSGEHLTPEDFAAEHPELADELRPYLEGLSLIDRARSAAGSDALPHTRTLGAEFGVPFPR